MTTTPVRRREPDLDDEAATVLVARAVELAKQAGLRVAAVVVDPAGQVVAARRQADSYPTTYAIATAKAFTSANFGRESGEMGRLLSGVERGIHITQADGRLLFIDGGCPLVRDGLLVGGLGVSGASADEDLACARGAIEHWLATVN
ncbi:GlcG/HbpS family heme-binding protein [Actinophytocola sediminis]